MASSTPITTLHTKCARGYGEVKGFEQEKIRHIVEAEKIGLGCINPKVVGDIVEDCRVEFRTPQGLKSDAVLG